MNMFALSSPWYRIICCTHLRKHPILWFFSLYSDFLPLNLQSLLNQNMLFSPNPKKQDCFPSTWGKSYFLFLCELLPLVPPSLSYNALLSMNFTLPPIYLDPVFLIPLSVKIPFYSFLPIFNQVSQKNNFMLWLYSPFPWLSPYLFKHQPNTCLILLLTH